MKVPCSTHTYEGHTSHVIAACEIPAECEATSIISQKYIRRFAYTGYKLKSGLQAGGAPTHKYHWGLVPAAYTFTMQVLCSMPGRMQLGQWVIMCHGLRSGCSSSKCRSEESRRASIDGVWSGMVWDFLCRCWLGHHGDRVSAFSANAQGCA